MSKIGKKPVNIPENTSVTNKEIEIIVSGPKGEVTVPMPKFIIKAKKTTGLPVDELLSREERSSERRLHSFDVKLDEKIPRLQPWSFIKVDIEPTKVSVALNGSLDNATLGRIRSEIANAVHGVTEGWTRTLEIVGTGYRGTTDGKKLTLSLGFSHPVELVAPEGIQFQVIANKITVSGVDKVLVGETAATIRRFREVEPYKGKGLRYENEIVRKKQGKAAKGAGSQ